MRSISALLAIVIMLSSCSARRTVCVTNKTGSTITLLVDSSYIDTYPIAFTDALNGLKIEKKKILDYGGGKWTKNDKSHLEEMLKHTRIIKDGSKTAIGMPGETEVSHISFNVEELWINIK